MNPRPLAGVRVVVTRARAQANVLSDALEALGADVIHLPLIRIESPTEPALLRNAVREAGSFDWLVFTSANGVRSFWKALSDEGVDPDALRGVPICAIGPGTARALEAVGRTPDQVPDRYVAEAVVETLAAATDLDGLRILLPRAEVARAVLPDALRARGAEVHDIPAYRTVAETAGAEEMRDRIQQGGVDLVTFTSGSTARRFAELIGTELGSAQVASIGPITSGVAREVGLPVHLEAREFTIRGLIEIIVEHYEGESG